MGSARRRGGAACGAGGVEAGEVVAAASGMAWEDFIQTRILDRLGMSETLPLMTAADPAKSAQPHGRVGPPLRYQGEMRTIGQSIQEVWNWSSAGAAGGFVTTPVDWAKWIAVLLARGALPDGTRLYSEARANEMWRPNIIISNSAGPTETLPGRAIASTYAMGWSVADYRGERMVTHGGGSPGGISGTVNLVTRKPLDSPGPKLAGSIEGSYGDLAKKWTGGFSILGSNTFETDGGTVTASAWQGFSLGDDGGIDRAVYPDHVLQLLLFFGIDDIAALMDQLVEHCVMDRIDQDHRVVRRARGGEIERLGDPDLLRCVIQIGGGSPSDALAPIEAELKTVLPDVKTTPAASDSSRLSRW